MGLLFLGRRHSALSSLSLQDEIAAAFWRAEAGESISASEKEKILSLISQVPDTATAAYALAASYLLLYGADALSAPPMVYVQRLQQFRSNPVVLAYLGRLAFHTGQRDKAIAYLREAIQKDPTCGPAYLFLSRIESDSACVWLQRGAQAAYTPAERTYRDRIRERLGCS